MDWFDLITTISALLAVVALNNESIFANLTLVVPLKQPTELGCGLGGQCLPSSWIRRRIVDQASYVVAVSLGAVLFGACTYIGNGPNFMVKSIAESANVKCPSFFGYVMKYSLPILIPLFAIVSWLFLR